MVPALPACASLELVCVRGAWSVARRRPISTGADAAPPCGSIPPPRTPRCRRASSFGISARQRHESQPSPDEGGAPYWRHGLVEAPATEPPRLPQARGLEMFRLVLGALGSLAMSLPAAAQVRPFPVDFRTREIHTNGTILHVRIGGHGPAVLLLHGYGETRGMWAPLAAEIPRGPTVVGPGLPGIGLSSRPEG